MSTKLDLRCVAAALQATESDDIDRDMCCRYLDGQGYHVIATVPISKGSVLIKVGGN